MAKPINLGFEPRPWQRDCRDGMRTKRFGVIVVHRRGGKTLLAIMRLIDAALRTALERARFGYVAPQRNQAKSIAWDYLKGYAAKIPGVVISEQELWVEFPNAARVRLFGADNPDSLRGQYFDGLVLDEVAQMKAETWGEILLPALSDRRGWALFIGTPKGINLFSELYYKALDDPDWFSASYDVTRTQALAPDEVERARKEMSENQFRQEFLCDFSASSSDRLISLDLVDQATRAEVHTSITDSLIMGVDVARFGDDQSVIIIRHGRDARFHLETHRGMDTMQLAGVIADRIRQHSPDAVFIDEGSMGGGVIDRLRQLGHSVIGVNFGSSPDGLVDGVLVANKRAEMWVRLRSWLESGGVIPNDMRLRTDLTSVEFGYDANNRILLESKKDMKARGLPSPDLGDALALTFAYPVNPRNAPRLASRNRTNHRVEYDPFGDFNTKTPEVDTGW